MHSAPKIDGMHHTRGRGGWGDTHHCPVHFVLVPHRCNKKEGRRIRSESKPDACKERATRANVENSGDSGAPLGSALQVLALLGSTLES